jgi:hypothetical protein
VSFGSAATHAKQTDGPQLSTQMLEQTVSITS